MNKNLILGKGSDTLFFQNELSYFVWTRDCIKDAYNLNSNFRGGQSFEYFPNIVLLKHYKIKRELYCLYHTEKYDCLTLENTIAYNEFIELKRIRDSIDENLYFIDKDFQNHKFFGRFIDLINESLSLNSIFKKEFIDTLNYLINTYRNLRFEISGRNVKVKNGHLLLLDCFFVDNNIEYTNIQMFQENIISDINLLTS